MRTRLLLLALSCTFAALPASATTLRAVTSAAAAPPPGAISSNVEYLTTVADLDTVIALAFDGDLMFVSTTAGLLSYDIANPAAPRLLGALPMYIWENEDMTIDPVRNRVFISRDPRGFTSPATPGTAFPYGAIHVVSYANPQVLTQVGFFTVPAGHTSTCVNACDFLWTGGPYANTTSNPGFTGRPIYATDVRDPANPVHCPSPIDTGRNDGVTDYAHDVQVDDEGIAWVSGAGGIRGYWTQGTHHDPVSQTTRLATACNPIPYGGGGSDTEGTPSRFMHNSQRTPSAAIPGDEGSRGNILMGTEENITSNCNTSGRFATYDLRGSLDGEGFIDIANTHFRMTTLDTWTPQAAEGADACASAHYFDDRGDGLLAYGFYSQGTRFLDVSNPTAIRQVGYFRPDDANTWAAYWHSGVVFIADNGRGIDIVRFRDDAGAAPADMPSVAAPPAATPAVHLAMDPALGYLCPLR